MARVLRVQDPAHLRVRFVSGAVRTVRYTGADRCTRGSLVDLTRGPVASRCDAQR